MSDVTMTGVGTVLGGLRAYAEGLKANALKAGQEIAQLLETYAKQNHPWKDDTGDTRASIKGQVATFTDELVEIVVSAGTPQSVFLELARSGRWAWLLPAVHANEGEIREILQKHLKSVRTSRV